MPSNAPIDFSPEDLVALSKHFQSRVVRELGQDSVEATCRRIHEILLLHKHHDLIDGFTETDLATFARFLGSKAVQAIKEDPRYATNARAMFRVYNIVKDFMRRQQDPSMKGLTPQQKRMKHLWDARKAKKATRGANREERAIERTRQKALSIITPAMAGRSEQRKADLANTIMETGVPKTTAYRYIFNAIKQGLLIEHKQGCPYPPYGWVTKTKGGTS